MMAVKQYLLSVAAIALAASASMAGQTLPSTPDEQSPQVLPSLKPPTASAASQNGKLDKDESTPSGAESQPLFNFHDSDIKFNLSSLMSILRDGRHEGWVLAAYPDPKTKRPLIGAGFSLDVKAVEHPQLDPLNPNPFVEPSSAQLWQAAGLEPERLQRINDRYNRDLRNWTTKKFRKNIKARALTPEVTDEEAMRLLRISAIQAINNARAYCRGFDQLTASQQMALSQLVYQMGINLEEFVQFLGALNAVSTALESPQPERPIESSTLDHWKAVQQTLIESQWARLYTGRASTVIAMLDPNYLEDPSRARQRVEATLRPIAVHRRKRSSTGSLRAASYKGPAAGTPRKKSHTSRRTRKLS